MVLHKFLQTPQYRITNLLLNGIGRVERAQGVIDAAPLLPTYERQMQHEALIDTIYASTHIEGNVLGRRAVEKVLAGEIVTARQRDIQEIVNYRNCLNYVDKIYRDTRKAFNDVMIREFHRVLMRDLLPEPELGVFRQVQNYIVDARSGKTVYTPPPAKEVPKMMLKMCDWLAGASAEACHPVIKAALAHYMMEAIHPFIDGNGRTGRVVAMFTLYRDGYDTRKLFSLEEYYDKNAKTYYESLQSVLKTGGDATVWVEYFVTGFADQIEEVADRVQEYINAEMDRGKQHKLELNKRQFEAVRLIQQRKAITAAEYAEHFKVSKRTANYDLAELMKKGVVRQEGESRSVKFRLV